MALEATCVTLARQNSVLLPLSGTGTAPEQATRTNAGPSLSAHLPPQPHLSCLLLSARTSGPVPLLLQPLRAVRLDRYMAGGGDLGLRLAVQCVLVPCG